MCEYLSQWYNLQLRPKLMLILHKQLPYMHLNHLQLLIMCQRLLLYLIKQHMHNHLPLNILRRLFHPSLLKMHLPLRHLHGFSLVRHMCHKLLLKRKKLLGFMP